MGRRRPASVCSQEKGRLGGRHRSTGSEREAERK